MRTLIRLRVLSVLPGALLLLTAGGLPAQEPGNAAPPAKAETPAARRGYDPARRVPVFFGQIGLTPEQREAIYKIRARHLPKVGELEKQIAELQAQSLAECEGVLTETQKQLLAQRRKAATEGKSSAAKRTSMRP